MVLLIASRRITLCDRTCIAHAQVQSKPLNMFCSGHQLNIVHLLQPRAGGGRLPQLYEAKVHVRLRLGIISRLLIMVYFYIARICVPGCIAYVKRATSQIACISVHGVRLVAKYSKRGE